MDPVCGGFSASLRAWLESAGMLAANISKAAIPSRIQPHAREGAAPPVGRKSEVRINFCKSLI